MNNFNHPIHLPPPQLPQLPQLTPLPQVPHLTQLPQLPQTPNHQQQPQQIVIMNGGQIISTQEYYEMYKKMETLMINLDMDMGNFLKNIADARIITEVRRQSVSVVKYKKYEDFIHSVDKAIRFYSMDTRVYHEIAAFILTGAEFTPTSNGIFGMKRKLEEIVQFFMGQLEPDLEEKIKQLKAILHELNIGLFFIKQKEEEIKQYIEEFKIHANAALIELSNIRTNVDEKHNAIRCWTQQSYGAIDQFFEAKCAAFKQQICHLEADLHSSVQSDFRKFESFSNIFHVLGVQLSNAVYNFTESIKFLEAELKQKMENANKFVKSAFNVTPNHFIQNVYIKKHPPKIHEHDLSTLNSSGQSDLLHHLHHLDYDSL